PIRSRSLDAPAPRDRQSCMAACRELKCPVGRASWDHPVVGSPQYGSQARQESDKMAIEQRTTWKGKRQKAASLHSEGKGQRAKGKGQKGGVASRRVGKAFPYFCLLPFAFCLLASALCLSPVHAEEPEEPFCEHGVIRIIRPLPN